MRRILFAAGLTLAVATASAAEARSGCEAAAHNRKVTGTALGALGGALLGSAVAGHGSKGTGALIGGVGGAVVGNQLSRTSCDHYAYGRSRHYARAGSRRYAPSAMPMYATDPRYTVSTAAQCHYVTRPYYDQAGKLIYAPMEVCE